MGVRVAQIAKTRVGKAYGPPYYGPDSFSCDGLAWWSFKQLGKTLPTGATNQYYATQHISAAAARPGDLVFYHKPRGRVAVPPRGDRHRAGNDGQCGEPPVRGARKAHLLHPLCRRLRERTAGWRASERRSVADDRLPETRGKLHVLTGDRQGSTVGAGGARDAEPARVHERHAPRQLLGDVDGDRPDGVVAARPALDPAGSSRLRQLPLTGKKHRQPWVNLGPRPVTLRSRDVASTPQRTPFSQTESG